jgi:fatty-acyl-CoA synthase
VQSEKVTFTGAVPTVWIAVKELIEKEWYDLSSLRCVPCGGSAAPKSLIEYYENVLGVPLVHAWGMTETSPFGTIGRLKSYMQGWPDEQPYAARAKQGYVAAGVELRIVGEDGTELPCDGRSMGEIQVRGPWVVGAYYDNPESAARFTEDGWFKTGDVGHPGRGRLFAHHRSHKGPHQVGWRMDLQRGRGEHDHGPPKGAGGGRHRRPSPQVDGTPWPAWSRGRGARLDAAEIIEFLRPQLARWALPDEVVFLEGVPKTSVGKFDKKVLRERFKDWSPPAERSS